MSMNVKMAFMVAIAMLLVTILKAPSTVSANQDSMETEKTAVKVRNGYSPIAQNAIVFCDMYLQRPISGRTA